MKNVKILFKRNGENVSTISPIAAYVEGMVNLNETAAYCISWDNDMLVSANVYEVREVEVPEWMDAEFYAKNWLDLKYVWGMGANKAWDEVTTKGLMKLTGVVRLIAIKLLNTKSFRSEFRKAMHERLVAWLKDSKGYSTPWTENMINKLHNVHVAREYKSLSSSLYHSR